MTLEFLRNISTVLALIAFIAICAWAYSKNRRDDFDKAANLPFADEALSEESAAATSTLTGTPQQRADGEKAVGENALGEKAS